MAIEIIIITFSAADIVLAILLSQLIVSQSQQKELYELNNYETQCTDDAKSQVTYHSSHKSRPMSIDL